MCQVKKKRYGAIVLVFPRAYVLTENMINSIINALIGRYEV